ncbi:PREDICTED: uncharacterized protein DDB_G0271670-like [Rhagoletis zephyria]|uniref:uncharacterized protein DDB_G0271670-like n=1 Tax=Rhagoletis zephyria TaxID=28612 RepID=UPI0008112286|nr:PREDICTED: uncharacterized protein DDB_G0271670-like [Rhagoletis zephyria]
MPKVHDKLRSGEKSSKRKSSDDAPAPEPDDQMNVSLPPEAPPPSAVLPEVSSGASATAGDLTLYLAATGIGILVLLALIGCSVHFIKKCYSKKDEEEKNYSSDFRKMRHTGLQTPDADGLYSPHSRTPSMWSSRVKGIKSATDGRFDDEEKGSLDQSEVIERGGGGGGGGAGGGIALMSKSISSSSSSNSSSSSSGNKGKSPGPIVPLPPSIAVNRDESQEVRKIKSTASHMSTGSTMSSGTPRSLIGSNHKRSVKAKGPAQGVSVTTVSTITPSAYGGSTSLISGTGSAYNPKSTSRPILTFKTVSDAEKKAKEKTLLSSSISSSANANSKPLASSNLPMSSAGGGKEVKTDSVSKTAVAKGTVQETAKEVPKA